MISILGSLRTNYPLYVACSGGSDSVFVVDFLKSGRHNFTVAHFNHGTEHGKDAEAFVVKYCEKNNLSLVVGRLEGGKDKSQSTEEFYRIKRYEFLNSLPGTVITAHHLNDVAETWIFSSLHGLGKLIPYKNQNVIRPFLTTSKSEINAWNVRRNVPYVNDPSNADHKYARNRIRHSVMPHALEINPGLLTVIKKKLVAAGI